MNRPGVDSVILLSVIFAVILGAGDLTDSVESQAKDAKAEQVYKNIQVLKDLSASQLIGAMNFMAGSLGVSCNHCHVPNQFAKDDKPAKQTARQHLQMMRAINDANFGGNNLVNCVTCHRGDTRPATALSIAAAILPSPEKLSASSQSLPTVDHILDQYLRAIGGKTKIAKLNTLTMTGTREMRNGSDAPSIEPLEIQRKAPNKLLMSSGPLPNRSLQAFDGVTGWRRFNGRISAITGADLVGARRDADLSKDFNLKGQHPKLVVVGTEKVGLQNAYVIEATFADTHPARAMFGIQSERLYFDKQSGLLIRRYMEYQTPLGRLPEATDYLTYQKLDGLMLPSTIRLSRPPLVVTQKFSQIRINAPIDDEVFQMPATK